MKPCINLKTYIPNRKLWVSTVAYNMIIGAGRTSETMAFSGSEKGIEDYEELYFESHGSEGNEKTLKKEHRRIVKLLTEKGVL